MKKDYVEQVAGKIIEQLEQGTAPWQKPWEPGELRLPYNHATGKEYRGINSMWLHMQGYSDPRWMTYNQANAEGAQVKKGSKGTHIVYWKFSEEKGVTDENGKPVIDSETGKQKTETVRLERPRSFPAVVFNAEQIDGLPPLEARQSMPEPERHARAEAILANSGAKINHEQGDRAFYRPSTDSITLPARNQFPTADNYYATALHEVGHWTGHPSRLDRDLSHPFGSEGYAREELRAEIASLMLGERLEIGHDPAQHAAYVGSWIKALKEDPREIFRAAADAERIAGFVMDFELEQVQTVEAEAEPRWTITQRDSTKENPETEIIGQTNSAVEAMAIFRSRHDTSLTDNHTGKNEGRTEWVRDGSVPEWNPSARFESIVAMEEKGISLPPRAADMPEPDHQLAEALMIARNFPEPESFRQTLLNREVQEAAKAAFGEPVGGIRSSELPDNWSGQARARPVVLEGSYEAGTLDDRDILPGETPQEWRIEVSDSDNRWSWFANGFSEPEAQAISDRLSRISVAAGLTEAPEQAQQIDSLSATASASKSEPEARILHQPPEKSMEDKIILAVPYAEKEQAKAAAKKAGFRLQWDGENKVWTAPAGADLSGLERWKTDGANVVKPAEPETPKAQFMQALKDAGLNIDAAKDGKNHPVDDGQIYRVPTDDDKPGALSGAYAYHANGRVPGGYIQNFKTGEIVNWKPEGVMEQLTPQERAQLAADAAVQKQQREASYMAKHEATADAALTLWNESPPATADNAYCKAKGISNPAGLRQVPDSVSPDAEAKGIRIAKTAQEAKSLRDADPNNRVFKAGDLLIPGQDCDGKIWTLQTVNPAFKSLMKGGRKHGLFTVAGADGVAQPIDNLLSDKTKPVILAEGYATADTVSRLSGQPVIVAFDSGNLDAVAGELRQRSPDSKLLFAADNDHNAPKEKDRFGRPKVNVGLKKAVDAAEKHGGGVMVPQFNDGEKGSDWNDLATSRGDDVAQKMLSEQMSIAKRDAAVSAERLTTLARTREMEARNDPTTSLDDAEHAKQQSKAAETLTDATTQLSEVRSMATDGLTAAKGAKISQNTAAITHKTAALQQQVSEERQEVLHHTQPGPLDGNVPAWKTMPDQAKQAMIDAVKEGKEVQLPKDAPAKLKQMAGQEPAPRPRGRGFDAGL